MGKCDQIIAVDIGTTRAKALLYQLDKGIIGWDSHRHNTYCPERGYVEQDPDEVLQSVVRAISAVLTKEGACAKSVAAVVLGGVWQSMVPVDRDCNPLCKASTWADSRAIVQNKRLKEELTAEDIRERTGCTIHPMYFPARLCWYRDQASDIYKQTHKFISIKEYVFYHLFGEFVVDKSIASGTGIMRMKEMDWDREFLEHLNMPMNLFSRIAEPTEKVGRLRKKFACATGLPAGIPAVIGAADGALSHLGSVGLSQTKMSLTVGTGAALRKMVNDPYIPKGSEAWCYYLAEGKWLLGGVLQDAGNALQWFNENFIKGDFPDGQIFESNNEMAAQVGPGAEGLIFLPLMGGERCPNYCPEASGVIYGLSFSHQKRHMVRALMEGISFRLWSLYTMLADSKDPELVVTGGLLKSPVWLKITADFFGKPLLKPKIEEASAWGGLLLGLKALGIIESLEQIDGWIHLAGSQEPDYSAHESYREVLKAYKGLYEKLY